MAQVRLPEAGLDLPAQRIELVPEGVVVELERGLGAHHDLRTREQSTPSCLTRRPMKWRVWTVYSRHRAPSRMTPITAAVPRWTIVEQPPFDSRIARRSWRP